MIDTPIVLPIKQKGLTPNSAAGNVMSEGNRLNGQSLQSFITSPVNRQPANDGYISIQKMYIHRFGNKTPTGNAALPTQ